MNTLFKAALLTRDTRFYEEIKAASVREKEKRLNVYRNNVFVSLIDALSEIFHVTHSVVGVDFFRAMARAYIMDNPPTSPVLSEYGDSFPDFIRRFKAADSLPFLADLASLEHQLLTLTHAQECETLSHDQVTQVLTQAEEPGVLRISLPSGTQLLSSPYAIGSLYQAHQNDGQLRLNQITMELSEYLLISKSFLYAQLHVISFSEACFLKSLLHNKTLEEAIPDESDFDPGNMLAKLMRWQLICKITGQPNSTT